MLTEQIKTIFLNATIEIADEIMSEAINTEHGLYWETLKYNGEKHFEVSIYGGVTGTLIFFVELYKITGEKKYYDIIKSGIDFLEYYLDDINTSERKQITTSFYSGIGGIIYLFLIVHEATSETYYLEKALTFFKQRHFSIEYSTKNDVLGGKAGDILYLLHLYNKTQDEAVLTCIDNSITELLDNIVFTRNGICWDRSPDNAQALCGFAHGASGMAFVFNEIYRFTNNDFFLLLCDECINYENQYYSDEENNWPDFRTDILVSEQNVRDHLSFFSEKKWEFFNELKYWSAWCHGAPGIGMSRIHAFSTTKNPKYLRDFQNAIANVNTLYSSSLGVTNTCTLCHGLLGNASLYIDGYVYLNDYNYLNYAIQLGLYSINFKKNKGYHITGFPKLNDQPADSSMFMGKAGIGHYYLRILNPLTVKSMLIPSVDFTTHFTTKKNYTNQLLKKCFPITDSELNIDSSFTIQHGINLRDQLVTHMSDNIRYSKSDYYKIDIAAIAAFDNIENNLLLFLERQNNIGLLKMPKETIFECSLSLNAEIYDLNIGDKIEHIIIVPDPYNQGTSHYKIGKYIYHILNTFINTTTPKESFRNILNSTELNINDDYEKTERIYFEQLTRCIQYGFLTFID